MRQRQRAKLLTGMGFERAAAYVVAPADASSTGADDQARLVHDWARRHQSVVVEWYFDAADAASQRLAERPGGGALLQATMSSAHDAVVVSSFDVFGASPEIILDAVKTLTGEAASVIAVRGGLPPALRLTWGSGLLAFPDLEQPDDDGPTLN